MPAIAPSTSAAAKPSALTGGLFAPVVTPFDSNEQVDFGAFRALAERLIGGGVNGLVVAGTTGEAHALDSVERDRIFRLAVEQSRGRVSIVAGIGATTTRLAQRYLSMAEAAGCQAALALTPWFEQPSVDALTRYYEALAQAARIPLLLYHNPSRTHVSWPPEALALVARRLEGAVAGVKDSTQDLVRVKAMRDLAPAGFLIFSGAPFRREEYRQAGAAGCIDGPTNLLPSEAARAYAGDAASSERCAKVFGVLERSNNFIGLLKYGLCLLGAPAGQPRQPFTDVSSVDKEELRTLLQRAGYLAAASSTPGPLTQDALTDIGGARFSDAPATEPAAIRCASLCRGDANTFAYQHHPALAVHQGRFFAAFSSGLCNEDSPGQIIRFATSPDGSTWSAPSPAFPSFGSSIRSTCGGLWMKDEALLLLGVRYVSGRYVDGERTPGQCWEEMATDYWAWNGEAWEARGLLLDNFYANEAPRRLPTGGWMMTGVNARHDALLAISDDADSMRWRVVTLSERVPGAAMKLTEPSWFADADGTLRVLLRDDGGSRRLWLCESRDAGATWSAPAPTDFPDAQAKFHALPLPGGGVALICNPSAKALKRRHLAVAVSRDGRRFEAMHTLRLNAELSPRLPGLHKAPGYQYPHAVVAGDALWVIYSVNKEDIEVAILPLNSLYKA
ncbi:MAG: hypothetical protein AMXMBFR7_22210 [Planctomycetota bacterium]